MVRYNYETNHDFVGGKGSQNVYDQLVLALHIEAYFTGSTMTKLTRYCYSSKSSNKLLAICFLTASILNKINRSLLKYQLIDLFTIH